MNEQLGLLLALEARQRKHIHRTGQRHCPSGDHGTTPIAAGKACDTCGAQR